MNKTLKCVYYCILGKLVRKFSIYEDETFCTKLINIDEFKILNEFEKISEEISSKEMFELMKFSILNTEDLKALSSCDNKENLLEYLLSNESIVRLLAEKRLKRIEGN